MVNLTKVIAGLLIAAALVLGVLAWMLARHTPPVATRPTQSTVTQTTYSVVVATRTLNAGQAIPADALRVQSLPVHPAGSASNPVLIAGRVPLVDIAAEAPVLETQLASSLATSLAPGERAIAVRVDEGSSVGYQIQPGNFVDVFFTLHRDGAGSGTGEIGRTQARLLVSKARVLVFGNPDDASGARQGTKRHTGNFGAQDVTPRTAVLAVPVTEIDKLALAQSQGQLMLALRNPTDDDQIDPSVFGPSSGVLKVVSRSTPRGATLAAQGVALDQLAGGSVKREPDAPRRSRAGSSIEVIRGGRPETVVW